MFMAVNVPRRDYQFSIARTALFANTLVVLPTGLGKTLIAAVVMYNFFRWFPEGIAIRYCCSSVLSSDLLFLFVYHIMTDIINFCILTFVFIVTHNW